jgi:hypothetical protein
MNKHKENAVCMDKKGVLYDGYRLGILHRVVWQKFTDVSEVRATSIIGDPLSYSKTGDELEGFNRQSSPVNV